MMPSRATKAFRTVRGASHQIDNIAVTMPIATMAWARIDIGVEITVGPGLSSRARVHTVASQKSEFAVANSDTGQPPGGVSAGIDIDSIAMYFRLVHRRMSMHDDLTEVLF